MDPDKGASENIIRDQGDQSGGVNLSTRCPKRTCNDEQSSEPAKKPRAGSNLALRSKLQDASQTIASLENKCSLLERENSGLRERNNEFQKDVLGLREGRGLDRMDDGDVRNMFDDLVDMCRNWAREYSLQGPVDFRAFEDLACMDVEEEEMLFALFSGRFFAITTLVYGNFMFLHTLLAHFSCWSIIDHPLFFLKQEIPESRSEKLQGFLSELMLAVPAHRKAEWIGSTLRMLFPDGQNHFHTNFVEYNRILSHTTNFYEQSARRLLAIAASLLRPLSEGQATTRLQSLVNIMASTGDLVLKLRKQNYNIKFLSHDSTTLRDHGFSRESEIMEPHPAMRLKPDNSRLDGTSIDFVIQPAIVAYCFGEGSKETREKVWSKAIVWAQKTETDLDSESAPPEHNESDDELVQEDPLRHPSTNSTGRAPIETFSAYPDPSGSTQREEPQYVNDYQHCAHPWQSQSLLDPLQRTHTQCWGYGPCNSSYTNACAHSAEEFNESV
ncbi:hypothetical protein AJ78_04616 [Emergomyces pasteurianus Ep9510]|uniref:Uncharacterized protein n=1 Tax=Emergomyces pasteurianus Ep9510 TaxID=1447872 RepID=A0A1J9Q4H4_9EURO|nr:hypothetical protein AJ78_04616 [Emergomyces pasteurianus Ep9510]